MLPADELCVQLWARRQTQVYGSVRLALSPPPALPRLTTIVPAVPAVLLPGVILLDLSSTMWHMVYANNAFREVGVGRALR